MQKARKRTEENAPKENNDDGKRVKTKEVDEEEEVIDTSSKK